MIRLGDRHALFRALEYVLRSGAFGLVLVDLQNRSFIADSILIRFIKWVTLHDILVLFLTKKKSSASSLGSLISLRGHVIRKKINNHQFLCEVQILKDKRRGPGWKHHLPCYGQGGLY